MLHGTVFFCRPVWQEKCSNYVTISFRFGSDRRTDRDRDHDREELSFRAVSKSVATFEPFTALERARTRATSWKSWPDFFSGPDHFQLRYVRARTSPIALSRKRIIVMVSLGIISALRVSWSPPLVKLWHAIPGYSHGRKSPVRQNVRFLRRSFWQMQVVVSVMSYLTRLCRNFRSIKQWVMRIEWIQCSCLNCIESEQDTNDCDIRAFEEKRKRNFLQIF